MSDPVSARGSVGLNRRFPVGGSAKGTEWKVAVFVFLLYFPVTFWPVGMVTWGCLSNRSNPSDEVRARSETRQKRQKRMGGMPAEGMVRRNGSVVGGGRVGKD